MKNIGFLALGFFLIVLVSSSTYTVHQHQQALVLQLGKIAGPPVTEPGLHFKLPIVQEVKYFEKRILQWDGLRSDIPTKDRKFIWVDTTARWQVADALKFYRAVRDVRNALSRMSTILNGVTRDVISSHSLIEAVRSSNNILQDIEDNIKEAQGRTTSNSSDTALDELITDVERIEHGREKLSELITVRAKQELVTFGIDLLDVQIRSIAYKEVVEEKVYNRMISERKKIADKILSSGKGERENIFGQLDLKLKGIESEAYRESQQIRGKAEGEAIRILAASMKQEPKYYGFIKNLEVYKETLKQKGQFILSTDNAFLKLMQSGS